MRTTIDTESETVMLVLIFWADTLLMTEDRENDRWNRTKIEIS